MKFSVNVRFDKEMRILFSGYFVNTPRILKLFSIPSAALNTKNIPNVILKICIDVHCSLNIFETSLSIIGDLSRHGTAFFLTHEQLLTFFCTWRI